ncbi:hypothetical protein BHS05_17500 [Myxococcus xanthus]|uniref:Cytochrome c domain-containing protein n=2 Tax=Myxococcus xanthus TaxID=34 RepID=A0AAE6G0B6_MYXXA|nr:hypothetical protein BHS09_17620 [Myxococcus xanthus]QDE75930.1 hypothetical protein BHS08_17635 [Myxococcus xanthus]QDE97493.1 hypothetical protein BHS05_17500 [Myxococcus xanthus]
MIRRLILGAVLCLPGEALAKPPAGGVVCATYPSAPACAGQQPACTLCHTAPPQRNAFGTSLEPHLVPGAARPLSDGDFSMALPAALRAVEPEDADGDGVTNVEELSRGTLPGDPASVPTELGGCVAGQNPDYDICRYDLRFAYRRVLLDFCGRSPTYAELQAFAARGDDSKREFIDAELERCTGSEFWRGKDGQLWKLAHPKIRPVGSIKSGEDAGPIPLADYYDDYALYAYAQLDHHDAREVMTATYYVSRQTEPTRYTATPSLPSQFVEESRRAGNLTSAWSLTSFVMFTALPRNAASQSYRAYLGLDIALQEGLYSIPGEPRDYDAKGVQASACAACHATLDPLSYPFRNYNGIAAGASARYVPGRIERYFSTEAPNITQIPESGFLLGQPVRDLLEWAHVGANSDAFAISAVTDYWKLLVGHPPTAEEQAEFVTLWQRFKGTHQYSVQRMLHDLIRTEAYGAP